MAVENQTLSSSHAAGFGGSDAASIVAAAKSGKISQTLQARIKDIKYKRSRVFSANTDAQSAGHDFESWVAKLAKGFIPEFEFGQKHSNIFATFFHADFAQVSMQGVKVIECKFSKKDTNQVINTYMAQCQWYYYNGACNVTLMVGTGDTTDGKAHVKNVELVEIEHDPQFNKLFDKGLRLCEEYYETLPDSDFDEIFAEQNNSEIDAIIREIETLTLQANDIAAKLDDAKAHLLALMQAAKIDKWEGEKSNVAYIKGGERSTFDTTKFKAENVALYNKYQKTTTTKDSVRITLKKD